MNWWEAGILGIGLTCLLYLLSRLQMKAWLHELDNYLGNKIQIFKEKDDEREEE